MELKQKQVLITIWILGNPECLRSVTDRFNITNNRAKNWRSHGRQWRVKTDQGHQKLRFERPMCDYATEFRKVAM